MKQKHPLAVAEEKAREIMRQLEPWCERIEIAGSIRRRKPEVSDIELVCIPKFEIDPADLFGEKLRNVQYERISFLRSSGVVEDRTDINGRPAFGERYQRLIFDGIGLDVFCVLPPAQWGVIFAIRTGSAEFSRNFMTKESHGGRMPNNCRVIEGHLEIDYGGTIPTKEERDFFVAIGMPWVDPKERV